MRRAPLGQVLGRLARYDWDSTPGKLRMAQIVLVLGILLAGGVGVYSAIDLRSATQDIAQTHEPLNANVTKLYQSLADADTTVAAGSLSGSWEVTRYDQDVSQAAAMLAQAGTQTDGDAVTAN
ncbi:MAG: hypothetical protein ABR608_12125, partial [Pseudonocardiaceae bacterium]